MAEDNLPDTGLSNSELILANLLEQIRGRMNKVILPTESTVFLINKLVPDVDFPLNREIREVVDYIKRSLQDNTFDPIIISLEDIKRNVVGNSGDDPLSIFRDIINDSIKNHDDIIIADTNCTIKEREQIISMLDPKQPCCKACVLLNKPIETYREEYKLSPEILNQIEANYESFQTPFFEEGFNYIFILNHSEGLDAERFKINKYIMSTHTVGEYGLLKDYNDRVKKELTKKTENSFLIEAANMSVLGSGDSNRDAYDFLSHSGITDSEEVCCTIDPTSTLDCAFYINYQDLNSRALEEDVKNFKGKIGKKKIDNLILLHESLEKGKENNIIDNKE